MINDFTKTYLFACPIYKIKIDPNSYDKEKILKDIKYNKSLKNTRNDSEFTNCDIHHSYEDFDNEDFRIINYEKLYSIYSEIFNEFFNKQIYTELDKEFRFEFEIVNYTAMTEGQWFTSHNHIQEDFATVHYLNFKDDHNFTSFYNPGKFAPVLKFIQTDLYEVLDNRAPDNSYMWESFHFPIEEDDMIIFPSELNHEIPVHKSTKEPRITISTNLWIHSHNKEKREAEKVRERIKEND